MLKIKNVRFYFKLPGRRNNPLPPTPRTEGLYASIDEMNNFAQSKSLSLLSLNDLANPQDVATTPYDIPRSPNDLYDKPKKAGRKKGGRSGRLMRAISRKISARRGMSFRRALSSDQLNSGGRQLVVGRSGEAGGRREGAEDPREFVFEAVEVVC